jgi:hypothetical protein
MLQRQGHPCRTPFAGQPAPQQRCIRVGAPQQSRCRSTPCRAIEQQEGATTLTGKPLGENLDQRILSGEFTDAGSTKEKLTRPVRKLLAQDPVGAGEGAKGWAAAVRRPHNGHGAALGASSSHAPCAVVHRHLVHCRMHELVGQCRTTAGHPLLLLHATHLQPGVHVLHTSSCHCSYKVFTSIPGHFR